MTIPTPTLAFAAAAMAVVLVITNVALFLGWRGQVRQTQMAVEQVQALRDAQAKPPEPLVVARTLSLPVLRAEEANLAPGQTQKLTFRLPSDLPDTIEIPLELPQSSEGAIVDVTLSSSGRTVWSERGLGLRAVGGVQIAVLRVPFATLQPHLGRPVELKVLERGHAVLATFHLTFGK